MHPGRCLFLAHCYSPLKKYAEALALLQHASIHIRETSNTLSILTHDPISTDSNQKSSFFSLSSSDVKLLEDQLTEDSLQYKRDWFSYNGGSTTKNPKEYEKPTFFNIALNYVPLNMEQLLKKAGKEPSAPVAAAPAKAPASAAKAAKPTQAENTMEKKPVARTKVEAARPTTPEPQSSARGGLSSLLGAWWGRS